jgi:anti-sigma B factor antagonist
MVGMATGEQLGAADDLLHIRAERDRDWVVIHVDGEIDYGTASQLRDEAASVVEGARNPRLVLDLGGVTFCDSSGLGVLVGIWKAVHALGGRLVLARVPQRCRQLLKGTGLAKILQVRDGLAEAVAAVPG